MKKLLFLVIIVIVFIISMRIGNKIMINYLKNNKTLDSSANTLTFTPKEKTYIKNSGEMISETIYEKNEEENLVDLTEEMNYDSTTNFHYKIITNKEEYDKYKFRLPITDMDENSFQNYFAIILFNENPRAFDETDLQIIKVYSEESNTHIVLKQKENASAFGLNNIFYAIAENSQLKNKIIIEIQK